MASKKKTIVLAIAAVGLATISWLVFDSVRAGIKSSQRSLYFEDEFGSKEDLYAHPWYELAWTYLKQKF